MFFFNWFLCKHLTHQILSSACPTQITLKKRPNWFYFVLSRGNGWGGAMAHSRGWFAPEASVQLVRTTIHTAFHNSKLFLSVHTHSHNLKANKYNNIFIWLTPPTYFYTLVRIGLQKFSRRFIHPRNWWPARRGPDPPLKGRGEGPDHPLPPKPKT